MHHAIMNVLEPVFERQFIFHTYACRKGKGSHKAIAYAFSKAKKHKYFLKLDVRKYFDNIDHEVLKKMLERIIKDNECLKLLFAIIDSYGETGKGLPIGNLTSQFFANFYLSALDHFILENLKVDGYVRYMDDFLVFGDTKNRLKEILFTIEDFCNQNLLLELKPAILGNSRNGVSFLGYLIKSDSVKLTQKSKKRKLVKFRLRNFEFKNNLISEEEYMCKIKCLLCRLV